MIDLGGFVGTYGLVMWMNNSGQVVGASNLPGDQTEHPFTWSKSTGMIDLFLNSGLGGDFGHPDWVNDAGEVRKLSWWEARTSCLRRKSLPNIANSSQIGVAGLLALLISRALFITNR